MLQSHRDERFLLLYGTALLQQWVVNFSRILWDIEGFEPAEYEFQAHSEGFQLQELYLVVE